MNDVGSAKERVWPITLTVVILLFIAGVIFFIFWTFDHKATLVTDNYYAKDLVYQQRIDAEKRVAAMPQPPAINYKAGARNISIVFPDFETRPDEGTIKLYRPSDATLDQTIPIDLDVSGVQPIPAASLKPGLWKVQLSWTRNGESHYKEEVVIIE